MANEEDPVKAVRLPDAVRGAASNEEPPKVPTVIRGHSMSRQQLDDLKLQIDLGALSALAALRAGRR